VAANVLRNKLEGRMVGISPHEVERKRKRGEDFVLLDVRTPKEYQRKRIPGSTLIPLGVLPGKLEELPRDKEIITFCAVSLRGYEASLILRHAGFQNVKVMDGGIQSWPYELEE
jgi:rhodanese-related sulfurtransferase